MRALTPLLLFVVLAGCSHAVHLSHIDDISPLVHSERAVRVRSEATQLVILGITTQTNYVNRAYSQLAGQCPNGLVTGITSRYSTSHGFFSWTEKLNMSGWCITRN